MALRRITTKSLSFTQSKGSPPLHWSSDNENIVLYDHARRGEESKVHQILNIKMLELPAVHADALF